MTDSRDVDARRRESGGCSPVVDHAVVPTPGYWKAEKGGIDGEPERWSVLTDSGTDRDYFVATIENGAPGDTLDTEEVNAKLIAAAPYMLEVLKEVALPPYPDSDIASLLETLRVRAKSALEKVV